MALPLASRRGIRGILLAAVLGVLTPAATALAGGGKVLPPEARPHGYSLTAIAAATAAFNLGGRDPATLPPLPFQVLYLGPDDPSANMFTVRPGTMFYVPIFASDDAPPVLGDFPRHVRDQEEVAEYFFCPAELGAEFIEIEVDGHVTPVGPDYAVGAHLEQPLPDGARNYVVSGVFLTPLSKGTHVIKIRARFSGDALDAYPDFFPDGVYEFEDTYTVIVR